MSSRFEFAALFTACFMGCGAAYADPMRSFNEGSLSLDLASRCPSAFLGVDSNDNHRLSEMEKTEARYESFSAIDSNRDSAISRDEYTACLMHSQAFRGRMYADPLTEEPLYVARTIAQFESADINRDDAISWNEFVTGQGQTEAQGMADGRSHN